MAEQTFKSPGFFETEIDLTVREKQISGIPAGVVGTAEFGPAFVPTTVGSMTDFVNKFGNLDPDKFGPYAVNEFFKNRSALTYVRLLGAGANETSGDITTTETQGTVKNAGFVIKGTAATSFGAKTKAHVGAVQFIVGNHEIHEATHETSAYPIFTDNDSFGAGQANIVRGMVLMASGARLQILDHNQAYAVAGLGNGLGESNGAKINTYSNTKDDGIFKLAISSSAGSAFTTTDGFAGVKIITASLDPYSDHYITKVLNTNPDDFSSQFHLLYADFPVESQLARIKYDGSNDTVAVLSGSTDTFRNNYGRFDTRYSNAKTTAFISQPFGAMEYDLFHFETLADGDVANRQVKISISELRRSTDPLNSFGSFSVLVRAYDDTDLAPKILEQFSNCTLDPDDENYVARKIGDIKVFYNFDATTEDERRITVSGKYKNQSSYVRIVMNSGVEKRNIPKASLPFGFRGLPCLVTNSSLNDDTVGGTQLTGSIAPALTMIAAIVPPVPFTIKATKGKVAEGGKHFGLPGNAETADSRIYWGVKTTALPSSSSISKAALASNAGGEHNTLIDNFTKFLGIQKLNVLTTGSHADSFNNNKFTLARVALSNQGTVSAQITGSADDHMLEAAYVRNGDPNPNTYAVSDGILNARLTLASLIADNSAKYFNRFFNYAKFTNVFFGGFDGLNILDKDLRKMNDRASSTETGGKADGSVNSYMNLHADANPGTGNSNNTVASYRAAIKILTDPMSSRINILSIPGQRDAYITDFASDSVKDYGKAIYLMDIPNYDDNGLRLFDDNSTAPSVRETSETFDARGFDNNFVATYFPNVTIEDSTNNRLVRVPASIAALGALSFTDSVTYPWFAPAGFNRGSLEFVRNIHTRLTAADRDTLYEARINPISNFPNAGFVIFGQKTLQFAKSSLDRVNVRRMLLEVRRLVSDVANRLVFEQNTKATRDKFIGLVSPLLATIQSQQGIDSFKVVMDDSNNTPEDAEQNRLNGRIVLVPTRAVEFIAIDFIITNSGVSFE